MKKRDVKDAELGDVYTFFNEINIIAQLSSAVFERSLPPGLTLSQFSVLNWFIRVDTEATPSRLAKAFMVTKGAMTNTLKKLEAKGLIDVRPDQNSGRQKIVTLTTVGRQFRETALKGSSTSLRQIASDFKRGAFSEYLDSLQEIRQYLDKKRYE